jgi:hypothetical protein
MSIYTIKRTGQSPIKFSGNLISEAGGNDFNNQQLNRYHRLRLYKTMSKRYVLEIEYQTCWEGEFDYKEVEVFATSQDLIFFLETYDHWSKEYIAERRDSDHPRTSQIIKIFKHLVEDLLDPAKIECDDFVEELA